MNNVESFPPNTGVIVDGRREGIVEKIWSIGSFVVIFSDGNREVVDKFRMVRKDSDE